MTKQTPPSVSRWMIVVALTLLAPAWAGNAQEDAGAEQQRQENVEKFNETADNIDQRLQDSLKEHEALIEAIRVEREPLTRELRELEKQLKEARREYDKLARQAANRAQEESNLAKAIEGREKAATFIANRFDEYIREFGAGVHIAELQQFEGVLEDAYDAMENRDLASRDRYDVQVAVIDASLGRLEDLLGGKTFQGSAIDVEGVAGEKGAQVVGTFIQLGPVVVFSDSTGRLQGIVEQAIGAQVAAVTPFNNPEDAAAVKQLAELSRGMLPLDTTEGEALVVESIEEETLEDELAAGGFVMYPLGVVAGLTVLIALYKFLSIIFTPSPSRKKLAELLHAVAERNTEKARRVAKSMRGPGGKMLQAGADHLGAPRELIEEVMYEKVLMAKLKCQRLLPFIAICAAAAPLLGLLGTVSGIINTFKMMQISGGADMQNVSGGISEALVTTKYGLIVAIPALILHVFLSRMARGVVDKMEKAGVAFINQVMKSSPEGGGERNADLPAPEPDGDTPPVEPEPTKPPASEPAPEAGAGASDETQIIPADQVEKEPALVESGVGDGRDKGANQG